MQTRHIGKGPGFFVAMVVVALSSAASRADVIYTVTGLGMLSGATSSRATAINNLGQVVGNSGSFGFLWSSGGGMQALAALGGPASDASGINSSGLIVGDAYMGNGSPHAFAYSDSGGIQDLGVVPGASMSIAYSVNDAGWVVGESQTGVVLFRQPSFTHAFLYTPGYGMVDLGTLGGADSQANGINASGAVVGFSTTATSLYDHAFIYTAAGGMLDLGICPA